MWFWHNRLEPEGLDADGAGADFGVPDKESRRKRLAIDLDPTRGVDQETEDVLFASVEPRRAVEARGRRLEIAGELLNQRQHVGVVEPRVAGGVERPQLVTLRVELQRLGAAWQGIGKDAGRRVGGQPIDRLLGNSRQAAELAETPVVGNVQAVVAGREHQPVASSGPASAG